MSSYTSYFIEHFYDKRILNFVESFFMPQIIKKLQAGSEKLENLEVVYMMWVRNSGCCDPKKTLRKQTNRLASGSSSYIFKAVALTCPSGRSQALRKILGIDNCLIDRWRKRTFFNICVIGPRLREVRERQGHQS
jgi:hypothetical protein